MADAEKLVQQAGSVPVELANFLARRDSPIARANALISKTIIPIVEAVELAVLPAKFVLLASVSFPAKQASPIAPVNVSTSKLTT